VFSAAAVAGSEEIEGSKRLFEFLASARDRISGALVAERKWLTGDKYTRLIGLIDHRRSP
jgi:hypothetical protein